MTEIQDPSFKERWPLAYQTIKNIAKAYFIIAGILGAITFGLMLFGGAWIQTDTQTTTLADGVQKTVTTTTANPFTASIVGQIGFGLYVSGMVILSGCFFAFMRAGGLNDAHLNSETEVEEK